ncbi:MAG: cytidine deaminase [Cloacibacillus sp.]
MNAERELCEAEIKKLAAAAERARAAAYAPYSGFSVGAALLFEGGETVSGCNVENASYGLSLCAERNAMAAAVARGHRRPIAAAIAGPNDAFCPPCGACRQFLSEFNPDMKIILKGPKGPEIYSLKELLPLSFSLDRE